MKITYNHIEQEFRFTIQHETERHADKLNRILKRYDPELVRLHECLEI
jgi:hypothetical protein